jgi:hypothetical protein
MGRCQIAAGLLQRLRMETTVQRYKQSNYLLSLILILILILLYKIRLISTTLYQPQKAATITHFQAYKHMRLLPFTTLYNPQTAVMMLQYHRADKLLDLSAQRVKLRIPIFFNVMNVMRYSRSNIN